MAALLLLRDGFQACRPFLWLPALVILGFLSSTFAADRTDLPAEFYYRFEGASELSPALELYGPEAAQCVKLEPEGLHLTLPVGYPGERPGTGVITRFGVKGDFEITLGFEILQEAEPGTGRSTMLSVDAVPLRPGGILSAKSTETWFRAQANKASLSRQAGPSGGTKFVAQVTRWNEETGFENEPLPSHVQPTAAMTGQLRLVRTGSALSYYVAEEAGAEFVPLPQQDAYRAEDLKYVRVVGSTGGPRTAFDGRVRDLRIRAAGFTNQLAASPAKPADRSFLLPLSLALGVCLAVPVGVWLYVRRRKNGVPALVPVIDAPAAAPVAFTCGTCGKTLKARAELGGKKVKCSQCGQPALVPKVQS